MSSYQIENFVVIKFLDLVSFANLILRYGMVNHDIKYGNILKLL